MNLLARERKVCNTQNKLIESYYCIPSVLYTFLLIETAARAAHFFPLILKSRLATLVLPPVLLYSQEMGDNMDVLRLIRIICLSPGTMQGHISFLFRFINLRCVRISTIGNYKM